MNGASMTKSSKQSDEGQAAKFAVVRLKPGDNLLGLFQLLIHNGFGEVSFVNNLTETIFPSVGGGGGGGKRAASPTPNAKCDDDATAQTVIDKPRPLPNADHYQLSPPQQAPATQIRTAAPVDNRLSESMFHQKINNEVSSLSEERGRRAALDLNLLTETAVNAQRATFASMPSNFLGLPTMPSLNTSAAAAAAIAALSEAATPPYSLANFFSPNNLATTLPSLGLAQQSSAAVAAGNVHQYSPALLAAAAAAQQRQAAAAASSTAATSLANTAAMVGRAQQMQIQSQSQPQQQRQATYPQQQQYQQQFQMSAVQQQPRMAFSQQTTKMLPQKSPAASPGSSSNSSTHSNQNRLIDGMLSANCAPMPPGCATTQLRQRGQRSYAEDPSLYVACRLCKNKIMGSRISNLTNHVRRHSSMKQFQCCYCDYTHNEMAKVRLHMLHNHKDKDSQPIDNLSPEMQASWDLLMKECFPDHCQQQQQSPQQQMLAAAASPSHLQLGGNNVASVLAQHLQLPPTLVRGAGLGVEISLPQRVLFNASSQMIGRPESISNGSIETAGSNEDKKFDPAALRVLAENSNRVSPVSSASPASNVGLNGGGSSSPGSSTPPTTNGGVDALTPPPQQHFVVRCYECGVYVNTKLKARHIRKCHLQCLLPFACSMCGYDHAEHSKVKVHICLKHDDDPMAQVLTRDVSTYAEQLVPEYFPCDNGLQYTAVASAAAAHDHVRATPAVAIAPEPVSAAAVVSTNRVIAAVDATTADRRTKTESVIVYGRKVSVKKSRSTTNVSCSICRRTVPTIRAERHARRHLSAWTTVFVCPICGRYESNSRIRIRRHLVSKHDSGHGDVKPLVFKRAAAIASAGSKKGGGGNLVKRALRRCFRSANEDSKKKLSQRYRRQKQKQQQEKRERLRKRVGAILTNGRRKLDAKAAESIRWTPASNGIRSLEAKIESKSETTNQAPLATTATATSSDLFRMCPLCAHWIRTDQLAAHLQTHVPSMGAASYRCNLCDYAAVDPVLVKAHFLQEHQQKHQQHHQQQQHQSHSEAAHQAAILMTYVSLCRGSTATAVDG